MNYFCFYCRIFCTVSDFFIFISSGRDAEKMPERARSLSVFITRWLYNKALTCLVSTG